MKKTFEGKVFLRTDYTDVWLRNGNQTITPQMMLTDFEGKRVKITITEDDTVLASVKRGLVDVDLGKVSKVDLAML